MREYIVGLKAGVDYNAFWHEMETNGVGSAYAPKRAVDIVDERLLSQRSCHYALTDDEANHLRNDPRVFCVEIPITQRDDYLPPTHCLSQAGLFYKTPNTYINPNNNKGVNWGLFRINSATNNTLGNSGDAVYNYTLDGTGVDIVIQDTGLQCDHPEFQDANGISRVQKINWWTAAGRVGNPPWYPNIGEYGMPVGFYTDTNGHGTHVAGIAAGKTYGRAKNANIYVMTVLSNPGQIPATEYHLFWDLIKEWHIRKNTPGSPSYTGRPTVVNMSWEYQQSFSNVVRGRYRTTEWTGGQQVNYGMIGATTGGGQGPGTTYPSKFGQYYSDVELDIQEMIAAGVVTCGAAANDYQTIDIPGGQDYENYYISSNLQKYYYMKGSVGCATGVICVGAVDSQNTGYKERKTDFSNCGPRVDVWAPGANIISSYINTGGATPGRYPDNGNFTIAQLGGTSMASPQVAGMCAQLLQAYPTATPAQIRSKIINDSVPNMLDIGSSALNYYEKYNLNGAPNRYAYMPYNTDESMTISGPVELSGVEVKVKPS